MKTVTVSSILKEGMIVNTRVGFNNIWYQNIVYKCEGSTIRLPLTVDYLECIVCIGTSIMIKYSNEYFEYFFEGLVTEIKADYPGYITLKIGRGEEMINTREFPRYDIYLAAELKPVWDKAVYFSVVVNVSLGGMAFSGKHDFDYGEELEIKVYLPDNKMVYAKGKTIRKNVKNEYINYSLQFTEMTEESSILLSDYLSALDDKLSLIRSNFFDCIKPLL